jgi:integrase
MPYRNRARGCWVATVTVDGRRTQRTAPTRAEAVALEAALRQQATRLPAGSLTDALARHLKERQGSRGWPTVQKVARQLAPHLDGRAMTAQDVATVVATLVREGRQAGAAAATINRRLALLRRILNRAHDTGLTDLVLGRRVKLLPERNQRTVYLTREQVEALAQAMPTGGDACRLAAHTGLRRGELLAVTEIRDGLIHVAPGKTDRGRVVPVPEHLRAIALPWRFTSNLLEREWQAARRATGLPHVRWHDLRHTYASWLVQAGVPLYTVGQLLGHSTPAMTQRYAHLAPDHLEAALHALAGLPAGLQDPGPEALSA